jgi:hypothetical protein
MNKDSMEKSQYGSKESKSSKVSEIKDDVIGGSSAGGIAGSGGVSTNDVGRSKTSKNPLLER